MRKLTLAAVIGAAALFAPISLAAEAAAPASVPAIPPEEQIGADVTQIVDLEQAENMSKFYTRIGGDPAINGIYVYLAVYGESAAEGWTVFQIGDFNSWEVTEQTKDHATLKISRSWVEESTGDIKSVEETWKVPMVAPTAKELPITVVK